ncbi:MAG: TfoX/Sxy family protein [Planctomycetes bacterium]|jgi:DNA transformation protein|nr:TfoX/Sxy family protein [Planctomycetota bacterium]MBE7492552.1 TfoX/Sxy family protein [Planctomycetota bacterium]MCL4730322.1 TfoX/Sxy family protein [Planctomycetota bacterium]
MAVSEEFVAYLRDQFSALGAIEVKRMFGGAGVYFGGRIFGLADNDVLYLKAAPDQRGKFQKAGCKPFEPWPGHVMAGYWTVPVDVQENRDQLAQWAKEALKAAPGKPRRRSGSERSARRKRK